MKYTVGNSLIKKKFKPKQIINRLSLLNNFSSINTDYSKYNLIDFNFNLSFPPRLSKSQTENIDNFFIFKENLPKNKIHFFENLIFSEWIKNKEFVFERNLEVWRQFFLGIEKSDCVAQVLDIKKIEFYINIDIINQYKDKKHIILINKADRIVNENFDSLELKDFIKDKNLLSFLEKNCKHIFYSCNEKSFRLINFLKEFKNISFVGYPNVGKSSTMNLLIGKTKSGVNSLPGKTKHLQTFILSDIVLLDTPGLVFYRHNKIDLLMNNVIISKYENWTEIVEHLINKFTKKNIDDILGKDLYVYCEVNVWSSRDLFEFLKQKYFEGVLDY